MPMVEYITDDGKEMLAQMLAGKITITFTKIQMGDGTLAIGQSRRTMTHLVNLIKELEVYRVEVTEENVVSIMGIFDNSDMTSGFWFREKGVFASDGINEVLFAYANAGDSAEYINPPTVESVEKQIISLYTNLQSTEKEVNINVVSGIYALNEDVEKHTFNTENPHGVTKSQVGLGNVPDVATNDQTPTYTVSTSNAELTSGEKLSVAFGKIAKAVSTLISHISTSASTSVLGHVKYGTTSGTACQGNDSRLSDSRTPKSHASTGTEYGVGTTSNYGHVKLSNSSAVTDSTGLALPATEKNASISGTLANKISTHKHPLIRYRSIKTASCTINANTNNTISFTPPAISGYSPVGIIGFETGNANAVPSKIIMSGSRDIYLLLKNTSSSQITVQVTVIVLYVLDGCHDWA